MNKHWQWGHPDDWSDEEWQHYLKRGERRKKRLEVLQYVVLFALMVAAVYWLGVGF